MFKHSFRYTLIVFIILLLCTACMTQGSSSLWSSVLACLGMLSLALTGMSQSGCEEATEPSEEEDREIYVGPCLSTIQPQEDMETYVGPCLSALPNPSSDMSVSSLDMEQDIYVGPCLSAPLNDYTIPSDMSVYDQELETDLDAFATHEDMGSNTDMIEMAQDMFVMYEDDMSVVGPCLSPIPPDDSEEPNPRPKNQRKTSYPTSADTLRKAALQRVIQNNQLPDDVLKRLRKP